MDDLFMKVLYDQDATTGWTRASAQEYMDLLKGAYPVGLELE